MPEVGVDDVLHVRASVRRQILWAVPIGVAMAGYLGLGAAEVVPRWLAWGGAVVLLIVVLLGGGGDVLRSRRAPWEVRLGPDGLTVHGHPTVPWSSVAEVRVTGLRPSWPFWLWSPRVVAFLGRPGVALPALPSARLPGALEGWAARRRTDWYGTQLVLLPTAMVVTTDALLGAVRRWSEVPIREA